MPEYPTLFARWTASLTVGGVGVPVPPDEDGLDWEGEVMAYVGRTLVDATPDEALDAVIGYSTFNDLTARRAQKLTSQWILGKNADRSGPLGPIVPAGEVGDLRDGLGVQTRVNGSVVQDGRTDEMVYTVGDTLALISRTFTLRPGDLLATGTPSGVGYSRTPPWLLQPGDVVEVEVDRLGVLSTPIVGGSARTGLNRTSSRDAARRAAHGGGEGGRIAPPPRHVLVGPDQQQRSLPELTVPPTGSSTDRTDTGTGPATTSASATRSSSMPAAASTSTVNPRPSTSYSEVSSSNQTCGSRQPGTADGR